MSEHRNKKSVSVAPLAHSRPNKLTYVMSVTFSFSTQLDTSALKDSADRNMYLCECGGDGQE